MLPASGRLKTPRRSGRILPLTEPTAPPEQASDEAAVRAVLAGDVGQFETLVRRYQRPIVGFLYRMVADLDLARDLSQDVFVRVYASLDRYDARFRFTTWLYRIAANCAIDHLRRRRLPTTSLDAPRRGEDGEWLAQPAGEAPDPERCFEAKEELGRLERSIRRLPVEYRELVLLRHSAHLSYDEMAKVTGRPLGTVKNRLFRARETLRALMQQES